MTTPYTLTRDDDYSTGYSARPVSEIELQRLQKSLGLTLPAPYREFLAVYNGGSFKECVVPAAPLGPLIVCLFFSVDGANADPVCSAARNMREYLPSSSIPVAEDPGGNVFYIDTAHRSGVFFWEHETRDTYLVSDCFGTFVRSLVVDL